MKILAEWLIYMLLFYASGVLSYAFVNWEFPPLWFGDWHPSLRAVYAVVGGYISGVVIGLNSMRTPSTDWVTGWWRAMREHNDA